MRFSAANIAAIYMKNRREFSWNNMFEWRDYHCYFYSDDVLHSDAVANNNIKVNGKRNENGKYKKWHKTINLQYIYIHTESFHFSLVQFAIFLSFFNEKKNIFNVFFLFIFFSFQFTTIVVVLFAPLIRSHLQFFFCAFSCTNSTATLQIDNIYFYFFIAALSMANFMLHLISFISPIQLQCVKIS